jgi:hypothetical protein
MAAHEFRQGTEIIYSDIAFYKKVGKAFADCIIYAFCGDSTLVDFLSQDIPSGLSQSYARCTRNPCSIVDCGPD